MKTNRSRELRNSVEVGLASSLLLLLAIAQASAITDDEYLQAYFSMAAKYYQDPTTKDEFFDVIEYYLANQDVNANLFMNGQRSGRQIRTILDTAGAPCEIIDNEPCGLGNPCLHEGDTCCCAGESYVCGNIAGGPTPITGLLSPLLPDVFAAIVTTEWQYSKSCAGGCCGRICCGEETGHNCYSDRECYNRSGACYVCPQPGGNCTLTADQCQADQDCGGLGSDWRCDNAGCCVPGDNCNADDDCGNIYGPHWLCQPNKNCKYTGSNTECSDGTPIGQCSALRERCMDGPYGDAILASDSRCPLPKT